MACQNLYICLIQMQPLGRTLGLWHRLLMMRFLETVFRTPKLLQCLALGSCICVGFVGSARADSAMLLMDGCRQIATSQQVAGRIQMPNTLDVGRCWGLFGGIQAISRYGTSDTDRALGICPPPESTRLQLILVFLNFLQTRPSRLHEDATDLAVEALHEAFPCRR